MRDCICLTWGAQPPRLHRSAPRRPERVFGEDAEHGTRGVRAPHAKQILDMDELTDIQRRVFDFVRDKLVAGRPAPTAREVAAQFAWSSKRAAECHVEALIRKGWLASEPGKARSLRLKDMAQAVRRAV